MNDSSTVTVNEERDGDRDGGPDAEWATVVPSKRASRRQRKEKTNKRSEGMKPAGDVEQVESDESDDQSSDKADCTSNTPRDQPLHKQVQMITIGRLAKINQPSQGFSFTYTSSNSNTFSYSPSITSTSTCTPQTIFRDGLRRVWTFLSFDDFKSSHVFRTCRHWWWAALTMPSLKFVETIEKYYDTQTQLSPLTLMDSPLNFHCPNLTLTMNVNRSITLSMLNLVTSRYQFIEQLRIVNTVLRDMSADLIRPILKLRRLIQLNVIGLPIHYLFTAQLQLSETVKRIIWHPGQHSPELVSSAPNHTHLRVAIAPSVEEFSVADTVIPGHLLQYAHYFPNLRRLDVGWLEEGCLQLLGEFRQLTQFEVKSTLSNPWDNTTPQTMLTIGPTYLAHLITLRLDMIYYTWNEKDESNWKSWCSGMTSLESLTFDHLELRPTLGYFHLIPHLTALRLNSVSIGSYDTFGQLSSCHLLRQLSLFNCTNVPDDVKDVVDVIYTLIPSLKAFHYDDSIPSTFLKYLEENRSADGTIASEWDD